MSTLDGPIWSRCSIALICPARPHFQRTQSKENGAKVGINVTAHQEKETKTGKTRAGENRKKKQATNFEEAVRCPSAAVQGAA